MGTGKDTEVLRVANADEEEPEASVDVMLGDGSRLLLRELSGLKSQFSRYLSDFFLEAWSEESVKIPTVLFYKPLALRGSAIVHSS